MLYYSHKLLMFYPNNALKTYIHMRHFSKQNKSEASNSLNCLKAD